MRFRPQDITGGWEQQGVIVMVKQTLDDWRTEATRRFGEKAAGDLRNVYLPRLAEALAALEADEKEGVTR